MERPYEKFESFGGDKLSDAELLAIIIKAGTKDKTSVQLIQELMNKYDYEDIDECIISLQRKDVESIGAKFNSYPMIMSLNDDDGFPIQIVWALSQSSGIMLYNKDDNSPFQAGQMISRFKSDKYKPYNKIFLMANDGVIIPSFINDFIQKQFDNGQG